MLKGNHIKIEGDLESQINDLTKQVEKYTHLLHVQAVVKGSLPAWQKHMLDKAGHTVYYKQAASTYCYDIDPEIKAVLTPHMTLWKQFTWMVQYKTYKAVSAIEKVLWGFNHSKDATPKAYALAKKVQKVAYVIFNGLGINGKELNDCC